MSWWELKPEKIKNARGIRSQFSFRKAEHKALIQIQTQNVEMKLRRVLGDPYKVDAGKGIYWRRFGFDVMFRIEDYSPFLKVAVPQVDGEGPWYKCPLHDKCYQQIMDIAEAIANPELLPTLIGIEHLQATLSRYFRSDGYQEFIERNKG